MNNLLLIHSLSIAHTKHWNQEMTLYYRVRKFKIMLQSSIKTFGVIW